MKPVLLHCLLASTSSLPLIISCEDDKQYSYIELGGFTLDKNPLPEMYVTIAKNECTEQTSNQLGRIAGKSRTSCELWFGSILEMNATSTLRAVYQCLATKPSGNVTWTKPKHPKPQMQIGIAIIICLHLYLLMHYYINCDPLQRLTPLHSQAIEKPLP